MQKNRREGFSYLAQLPVLSGAVNVHNIFRDLFISKINYNLFLQLKELDVWLPKEVIVQHMPEDFKHKYPDTRVTLDATEWFIQKPGRVKDQAATWSSYKNHNTLKCMVGISPRGQVTHISDAYGGAASDRQVKAAHFFTFIQILEHSSS